MSVAVLVTEIPTGIIATKATTDTQRDNRMGYEQIQCISKTNSNSQALTFEKNVRQYKILQNTTFMF